MFKKTLNNIIEKNLWVPIVLLPIWLVIYHYLQPVADWIVDSVLGLEKGKHITEALRFFIFEVPKVIMLLALIIFFVGIIRTYFPSKQTEQQYYSYFINHWSCN